jgi:putative DNA methylase
VSDAIRYPRRLIEVDLPIRKISAHARREKQIRHGHISTLHLWWARRPLGACRAVLLAAVLPDPLDELCPTQFIDDAANALRLLRDRIGGPERDWTKPAAIRDALLAFIADFANWDLALNPDYVATSRQLTASAHLALTGLAEPRSLVADPFAGGGAIPLEALRLGLDAFASDLNPIAVLLNRIVLEYLPAFGDRLTDEVRKWGAWLKVHVADQLAPFYPAGAEATPIAYLWARTIRCEGPGCGVEIPLVRSTWLANKGERRTAMRLAPSPDRTRIDVDIVVGSPASGLAGAGTIRKGSATCPVCNYTTPNARVRLQLASRHGGTRDARLLAVVVTSEGGKGRQYRVPTTSDLDALEAARQALGKLEATGDWLPGVAAIPDEEIPRERPSPNARGLSAVTRMGMQTFGDLVTERQALSLLTLVAAVRGMSERIEASGTPPDLARAVVTCLGLLVSKQVDRGCSLCRWDLSSSGGRVASTFGRQALSVVWDFVEPSPIGDASGDLGVSIEGLLRVLADNARIHASQGGHAVAASATKHPLPDDAVHTFFTDPPYYDAIPYADLSDFFYVWLRRALGEVQPDLFTSPLSPKDEEAIWNPSRKYGPTGLAKDEAFYESQMAKALREGRRITAPGGIGLVVFAHKSTAGWEAILGALLNAGWIATASWPIDTEMGGRVNAMGTASLASSVHIVCRPREGQDGSERDDAVGDWREVLAELPRRIHDWMPRLADEGVVGADAIFACLGPALEIFSRYSRVEKTSGHVVSLKEYLEQVWAAVAHEALTTVLGDADTSSVEPDARLSVIWLWTLGGKREDTAEAGDVEPEGDEEDEESDAKLASGFVLEYDAARKLAQGLGAKLEELTHTVEVTGSKARLLSAAERLPYLFGKSESTPTTTKVAKRRQTALPGLEKDADADAEEMGVPRAGATTLDRVHQAMLLFASGRGEALRRFLVDDGVGKLKTFWTLAQALSALYPGITDEKRWIDGVLARKKGLGF